MDDLRLPRERASTTAMVVLMQVIEDSPVPELDGEQVVQASPEAEGDYDFDLDLDDDEFDDEDEDDDEDEEDEDEEDDEEEEEDRDLWDDEEGGEEE
jgi:segregation and condensation protein B